MTDSLGMGQNALHHDHHDTDDRLVDLALEADPVALSEADLRRYEEVVVFVASANPVAHDRSLRIHRLVVAHRRMHLRAGSWETELAAAVSGVGLACVPATLLVRYLQGQPLHIDEHVLIDDVPRQRDRAVSRLPNGDTLLPILHDADRRFDENGTPSFSGSMIRIAAAIDTGERRGLEWAELSDWLHEDQGSYDPVLLEKVLLTSYRPRARHEVLQL
ncbi:MAG: HD domain-containing phosphohydrolase [Acidimicrobiales bacterium]